MTSAVPYIVHEVLSSPGRPLDASSRAYFEPRFGHDLSRVRVHTGAVAEQSAQDVDANAYTVGHDIVFAAGRFAPATHEGKRLIAHELVHVMQQTDAVHGSRLVLRRQPKGAETPLPFVSQGVSFFEEESSEVTFLAGVDSKKERHIREAIPAMGKQIAADNLRIADPKDRVMTCFIVPTTTRYALWEGKPTLMLDSSHADTETAAHEMGHAIFVHLQNRAKSKEKDAAKAGNFRLRVADIYARLEKTKPFTVGKGDDKAEEPAGIWIADPSQWGGPGAAGEHPWDNAEEFFASAKAGFQVNRKGFESAIARFSKFDPAVEGPAKELLALLDVFFGKGELPSGDMPEAGASAAHKLLEGIPDASKVENAPPSFEMDLLLNPGKRPKPRKARP